ncbi:MAG TPA: carboxymuconolactone decarboxylase [Rhodocyclaceae bacterium]|nr:MAG: carboxymuconolactone decarboxylase [Betaproteobacteria bacterium CG2_30_68_42]PIX73979.1 MAG: carboxymuconolactone decarboxylase [Rhodocyclales bacterium CG_4_10_14_3_um_filter_68_10]PJA57002.1 MAG: carboxymuconolactone decarboxylase [Rhodocyclales bacterium CG_4_9_14_3_um_filter_68_10]HCX33103.1 carboxymuconolactone decarboxylase [Rhodocyclaceae bacterium]
MSDALGYLIKVRPNAMAPYFKFLKEAGRHLDPKTRNLISVITKVHAQTENGFRQYLVRALREGASADEILDALLMAFPALGLAKIVWATDLLLEMDIPEFRPALLGAPEQWHDVMAAGEAKPGEALHRECDGRRLFVYRTDEELRVYDSRCPHQVTDIPHLALEGTRLTCPKHHWAFDIGSGQCIEKGDRPLTRFEHKVENNRLLAYW